MAEAWGEDHITLGEALAQLEKLDPSWTVEWHGFNGQIRGIENPHSYRGYYNCVAFEPCGPIRTVGATINLLRSAIGPVFEGWKGGDYVYDRNTPIFIAIEGECGSEPILTQIKWIAGTMRVVFVTEEDDFWKPRPRS